MRNNYSTDFFFSSCVNEDYNIEITINQASTYFADPSGGNGNYHLIATSSAIDAGSNLLAPAIDKDGTARPQGSGFDIGCYEYTSTTEVVEENIPQTFQLFQKYPNPFNPSTKISWQSTVSSWQTLKIYDVLGNEVATLVDEFRPAGNSVVDFDTSGLPSSVYIYQLIVRNYIQTRKMVLLK